MKLIDKRGQKNLGFKTMQSMKYLRHKNTRIYVLFLKNKFIYLFMAVLGLRCCVRAFSSCGERGLLFVAVRGLLIAVASLVAEHGL